MTSPDGLGDSVNNGAGAADVPLLATKLFVPALRADQIPRPHLIQRLRDGLQLGRKLTLLSAPAGYGKTTLLSGWDAESERPFAWVSLDEGDNDPTRFFAYVIASLRQVDAGLGETALAMLGAPPLSPGGTSPLQGVVTNLINDIAALDRPCVLVLDDYHLIEATAIHGALGLLLEHAPGCLHLVIATRVDPPLNLARLRGRGQLTELRQGDLRFTLKEALSFLRRATGLDLGVDDVAALEEHTEGWITGLQLAALSMRGRDDISAFVSAFAGSHRYVLDYLTEEVLRRQPNGVRQFLLHTSILDRMSAPLCEALMQPFTGTSPASPDGAQALLERLERANLFVVPLDDGRVWYRYHRLFADLLRARLAEAYPARVPVLHAAASAWYETEGMLTDAFKHAVAAGDVGRATRIVETHGRSLLLRGELGTLLRWIAALPEAWMLASARLCVTQAWALLLTGQAQGIEPWLQQAEQALADAPADPLRGDVAVIRAYAAAQQGDLARTVRLAHLALERLPATRQGERGVALFVIGAAHVLQRDWPAAARALGEAAAVGRQGGNLHLAVPALNALANIQALQGRLHQAKATAEEALDLASGASGHPLPIAAGAVSALAKLAYERNALDTALDHARQAVELGRRWGNSDALGHAYLSLATVLTARAALEEAAGALTLAEQAGREMKLSPGFAPELRAVRARLWLAGGDLPQAARWAREAAPSPADGEEVLALARVHLALGRPDAASSVLAPLLEMARTQDLTTWRIAGGALWALIHQAQGEEQRALNSIAEALTLAQAERYVRCFLDLGTPLARLLRNPTLRDVAPDYVQDLLAAFGLPEEMAVASHAASLAMVEPLSSRELEVLSLVAEGMTNREIGARLHIAESTVKSHLNTVYGKLDVQNRTQAVAKARSLSIF